MLNKVIAADWESEEIHCDENNIVEVIYSKLSSCKDKLFVLAYFIDSVEVGYYTDKINFYNDKEFCSGKLEEIRIFNKKTEFKLINNVITNGTRSFVGRIIEETTYSEEDSLFNSEKFIYDERFLVYGKGFESKELNGWTMAKEDRGRELWLPIKGVKWLGVRNYLKYDEGLKFVGNRLMGFYDKDENYLGYELNVMGTN